MPAAHHGDRGHGHSAKAAEAAAEGRRGAGRSPACLSPAPAETNTPGAPSSYRSDASGRWTLDAGRWTLEAGRWTLDAGNWKLEAGRYTLDVRLQTRVSRPILETERERWPGEDDGGGLRHQGHEALRLQCHSIALFPRGYFGTNPHGGSSSSSSSINSFIRGVEIARPLCPSEAFRLVFSVSPSIPNA